VQPVISQGKFRDLGRILAPNLLEEIKNMLKSQDNLPNMPNLTDSLFADKFPRC
jgi:hypothetical protein